MQAKDNNTVLSIVFIPAVAKSTWDSPYWREMVRVDYATVLYDIIMMCYVFFNSLWWAMHNCAELEHLNLSKNKRISGQVPIS